MSVPRYWKITMKFNISREFTIMVSFFLLRQEITTKSNISREFTNNAIIFFFSTYVSILLSFSIHKGDKLENKQVIIISSTTLSFFSSPPNNLVARHQWHSSLLPISHSPIHASSNKKRVPASNNAAIAEPPSFLFI